MPEVSVVAAKYETLRMAALGQPLPPEARSGLALLLRRGLWGWARALVQGAAPPEQSASSSPPRPTAPRQHKAVIQILAAMAMKANDRRAA
jgi:hypothetical protein